LTVPTLDASVGMRYGLTVADANGVLSRTEHTFCLIAENEAPIAVADTFVVVEGAVLTVTTDGINLLSNDSDDTDVSNTESFSLLGM